MHAHMHRKESLEKNTLKQKKKGRRGGGWWSRSLESRALCTRVLGEEERKELGAVQRETAAVWLMCSQSVKAGIISRTA